MRMNMAIPQSGAAPAETTSRHAVLLFTDVVGSTALKSRLGTCAYTRLLARHNALFESLCAPIQGAEILKHTGDGFFVAFETASDAVRFALLFQQMMRTERWDPQPLTTRIGIHSGEVALMQMAGKPDVVGLAADVAARVMSLGAGGQILMTRAPFDDARQFVADHPEIGAAGKPVIRWIAHGRYTFDGGEEPLEVFEVGVEGAAPLAPPPDSGKARRAVPHDQEQTLGWRPAIGLEIPHRVGWILQRKLGEGGFGEVWLGKHEKAGTRRVFKFCFDVERLRSFKRELTLVKLLRDALGDRNDIAKLYEVQFKEPPFFLESEYTEGGNLLEWSDLQGGIHSIPLEKRLRIFSQVATAVAAAHSVGILHKDIKPTNILIHTAGGHVTPRLADFGIGLLLDRSQLDKRAITMTGFTNVTEGSSSKSSTLMYAPPELMADKPFTVQGDIYALGVLLFQMVVGDLKRPLASGWERDVTDDLLRNDIAECVDGEPSRRPASAQEVSDRIERIEQRHEERARQAQARLDAKQARQRHAAAEQLARRRRAQVRILGIATAGMLIVLLVIGALLHRTRQMQLWAETKEVEAAREALRAVRHLADIHVRDGLVQLDENKPATAMLWFAKALEIDGDDPERARLHRVRIAIAQQHMPRLLDLSSAPALDHTVQLAVWGPDEKEKYRVQTTATPPITLNLGMQDQPQKARASADLSRVVTIGLTGSMRVWDVKSNRELTSSLRCGSPIIDAWFDPTGGIVFASCEDGATHGWEIDPISMDREPATGRLQYGDRDSAGGQVAVVSESGAVRLLDAATGKQLGATLAHKNPARQAAISPDAKIIITIGSDRFVRRWDSATGQSLGRPLVHDERVCAAHFNPDGKQILTAGHDGYVRVFDSQTGVLLRPPLRHRAPVRDAAFSSDGLHIRSVCADGSTWTWDLNPDPRPTDDLRRLAELLSCRTIEQGTTMKRMTDPTVWRKLWNEMRAKHPQQFKPAIGDRDQVSFTDARAR